MRALLFFAACVSLLPVTVYAANRLGIVESDQGMNFPLIPTLVSVGLLALCILEAKPDVPTLVRTLEHDPSHFTQGFSTDNDYLYETTGLYGQSGVYKYDLETGKLVASNTKIREQLFLEGCTMWNGELYVLTWKENVMLVIDPETLEVKEERPYNREGWGLTNDEESLIASDGTSTLYFLDEYGKEKRQITVRYKGLPVDNINELEYQDGRILANRWQSDRIYVINPDTGVCEKVIDLSEYAKKHRTDNRSVPNGIAYHEEGDVFLVTGKLWDTMYVLEGSFVRK